MGVKLTKSGLRISRWRHSAARISILLAEPVTSHPTYPWPLELVSRLWDSAIRKMRRRVPRSRAVSVMSSSEREEFSATRCESVGKMAFLLIVTHRRDTTARETGKGAWNRRLVSVDDAPLRQDAFGKMRSRARAREYVSRDVVNRGLLCSSSVINILSLRVPLWKLDVPVCIWRKWDF